MKPLNILIVATKAPWPAVDGGRFLLRNTLQALAAAGCRLTLVAPVDAARFDLAEVDRQLSGFCTPALVPAAPLPPFAALLRSAGAPISNAATCNPARQISLNARHQVSGQIEGSSARLADCSRIIATASYGL